MRIYELSTTAASASTGDYIAIDSGASGNTKRITYSAFCLNQPAISTTGSITAATVTAFHIGKLGSIFEIANKVINGFGSPLLAIFLLGMFCRRANSNGLFMGGILGTIVSAYVSLSIEHLALHYYAVINLVVTLACCYCLSIVENHLTGGPSHEQLVWTWKEHRSAQNHGPHHTAGTAAFRPPHKGH